MKQQDKTKNAPEMETREQENKQEAISEDELTRDLTRKLKRETRLAAAWWVATGCIAGLGIVDVFICDWLRAFNNAMWLFIAWTYWRYAHAHTGIMQILLDLARDNISLRSQNAILEKLNATCEEMAENYREIINIKDKQIEILERRLNRT